MTNPALPVSILDTDSYKLTMQQAILQHFPDVQATYRFTNRNDNMLFSHKCFQSFCASVALFANLTLSPSEQVWLQTQCPWFSEDYLDYLSAFRFNPDQVSIQFIPAFPHTSLGQISIQIKGPWSQTILWEVPLMATLSETYFQIDNTDWNYDHQQGHITTSHFKKANHCSKLAVLSATLVLDDADPSMHKIWSSKHSCVPRINLPLIRMVASMGRVYLAYKYNLIPIGTIAHEWFMGIGALRGYTRAHNTAFELWEEVYPNTPSLLIALTDTFTTQAFFQEITQNPERVKKWTGLRHDSGDPFSFALRVKETYENLGINHREKLVVFSDSLDVEKAIKVQEQCNQLGFKRVLFGIGTFFTNDFRTLSSGSVEKNKPLNIVIKISSVDGLSCVKISDDLTKNTGDKDVVDRIKQAFGLKSP